MLSIDERLKSIVRLPDNKGGHFPDGAHVVRVNKLPWTPFNLVGTADGPVFKLLAVDWRREMFVMILNVPGGMAVEPHYHLEEAQGYIMTGDFEYEYGHIFAENYIGEGAAIAHSATIGKDDVTIDLCYLPSPSSSPELAERQRNFKDSSPRRA